MFGPPKVLITVCLFVCFVEPILKLFSQQWKHIAQGRVIFLIYQMFTLTSCN